MSDEGLRTAPYVFDTSFAQETERLRLGARLWDPGSRDVLAKAGIEPGRRYLEVGAGTGTIAGWLADRAAPGGAVTATDLSTDPLAWLTGRGVRVLRHDLATDPLPESHYDLVHARLVIPHLPDRQAAVTRMARSLRPGGVLVLEDTETSTLFRHPSDPAFLARAKEAAYAVMEASGYDRRSGLGNASLAERAGLTDVTTEGRAQVVRGGTDAARWYRLWIAHLAPRMVDRGLIDTAGLAAAERAMDDPAHSWLTQVMLAVTARRPGRTGHRAYEETHEKT